MRTYLVAVYSLSLEGSALLLLRLLRLQVEGVGDWTEGPLSGPLSLSFHLLLGIVLYLCSRLLLILQSMIGLLLLNAVQAL